ncbi:MAG TPA: hypothetical protein VJZ77_22305 [Blastocatellia bacterium]|nr:hypothetical protein [Blastocatellia bacterium]
MKRKELLQSVKEVLFREWDPIGLNSNLACSDEYDSYTSGIVRLLQADADEYKIAERLRNLQRVSMGMSSTNEERDRGIARRLISLVR